MNIWAVRQGAVSGLAGARGHPPLRVLQSQRLSERDNPYLKQMVAALSPYAEVAFFSWRTALFGRYDLFHVHWPEFLLRAPERGRGLQAVLFLALLLRLALTGCPVVRTVHNREPHEAAGSLERLLLGLLERRTRLWIHLNPVGEARRGASVTILHGHYRDWFALLQVPPPRPGRLLHFGLIRPYKGVEALLDSFLALAPGAAPGASLRIVGQPASAELGQRIAQACAADRRISACLAYVDDPTLAREIGQAELVVLPFRRLFNSGSLLLALSLDRPVLVPRNAASLALAREVGPGWVHLYEGELHSRTLAAALERVRATPPAVPPDFSRREWGDAGRRHYQAYLAALGRGGAAEEG